MLAKIKELTRSDRPIIQMSFRSTIRSMVKNMKQTFMPKTGIWKKQVLQDPGYAIWWHCQYMLHAACNEIRSHSNSFCGIYRHCWQIRYHTQYTIVLLTSFVLTISTCPLMYTQQIRWQWSQWVASSLSNSK